MANTLVTVNHDEAVEVFSHKLTEFTQAPTPTSLTHLAALEQLSKISTPSGFGWRLKDPGLQWDDYYIVPTAPGFMQTVWRVPALVSILASTVIFACDIKNMLPIRGVGGFYFYVAKPYPFYRFPGGNLISGLYGESEFGQTIVNIFTPAGIRVVFKDVKKGGSIERVEYGSRMYNS